VLQTLPDPALAFARRGAAFTFDAPAFIELLRRLRNEPVTKRDNPALSFKAPSFDHSVKDPVAGDIYLSSAENLIMLEGNYLLLNEEPWNEIAELVDEK
jgi:pantothenate kinase